MDPDHGQSPPKKKKVDICPDKCIVCMRPPGKKSTTVPALHTLKSVLKLVKERYEYGDSSVKEFWERIANEDPEFIAAQKCFYHRCCYPNKKGQDERKIRKMYF